MTVLCLFWLSICDSGKPELRTLTPLDRIAKRARVHAGMDYAVSICASGVWSLLVMAKDRGLWLADNASIRYVINIFKVLKLFSVNFSKGDI